MSPGLEILLRGRSADLGQTNRRPYNTVRPHTATVRAQLQLIIRRANIRGPLSLGPNGMYTWQAIRFEGLKKGRTRPLLLGCERVDGAQVVRSTLVVKAIGLPEVATFTLGQECAGLVIAKAVDVSVPEVGLVDLSPEFVEATAADLKSFGLTVQPGTAVGAAYLQGLAPVNRNPQLREEEIPIAARIYALDLVIQNPDRRTDNPNCGYYRKMLTAYDFEAAFSFRLLIGPKPDPCDVSSFGIHRSHLFFEALRGKSVQWTRICHSLCSLDSSTLAGIYNQAPPNWHAVFDSIGAHLVALRGRAAALETQIRRSLS